MINVELLQNMGDDLTVVNAARVSFDKESDWEYKDIYGVDQNGEWVEHIKYLSNRDEKLIKYLADEGHRSPFGHCFATFRVTAPIFVARQLVKHKFLRWNEVSRRYVDTKPTVFSPTTWRSRAEDIKQGSSDVEVNSTAVSAEYDRAMSNILSLYDELLEIGVCPEQARMVLPQSSVTQWWWSGSLDAFADMCILRKHSTAQRETQEVANLIDKHMAEVYPVSWKALMEAS